MKIGVIDSSGLFNNKFFEKKIEIKVSIAEYNVLDNRNFSHAEYVCAAILSENPDAQIILYGIIGKNLKNNGLLLYDSLKSLIYEDKVNIINISAGVEIDFPSDLYNLCREQNIPIISAHANDTQKKSYPASFDNVIGVKHGALEDKIIAIDDNNDLIVNEDIVISFKSLGQEELMIGNSYYTAKIVGIISTYMSKKGFNILDCVEKIINSPHNRFYTLPVLSSKKTLMISNRIDDENQKKFIKYYFSKIDVKNLFTLNSELLNCKYDLLFIDINNHKNFMKYKANLTKFIINNRHNIHQIFIRYPFFSLQDKVFIYKNYKIQVEQIYF